MLGKVKFMLRAKCLCCYECVTHAVATLVAELLNECWQFEVGKPVSLDYLCT